MQEFFGSGRHKRPESPELRRRYASKPFECALEFCAIGVTESGADFGDAEVRFPKKPFGAVQLCRNSRRPEIRSSVNPGKLVTKAAFAAIHKTGRFAFAHGAVARMQLIQYYVDRLDIRLLHGCTHTLLLERRKTCTGVFEIFVRISEKF